MSGNSGIYPITREAAVTGAFTWGGTIKVALMAAGYVPDFTNQYLSDLPPGMILATSGALTTLATSNGYCTADTVNFGILNTGQTAGSVVFYFDSGTPSSSQLIVFIDTPDCPGLPVVLNGLNYYFYQNIGAGGWFRV